MKTLTIFIIAIAVIAIATMGTTARAEPGSMSANFMANINTGAAPLTVHFTDTSEGSPTGWQWDFGDGSFSKLQNPVYTYNTPGTYTVTLSVTNGVESVSSSGTIVVTAKMVTTPIPNPRQGVIVQPILVPVKDPQHAQPPRHDQPPVENKQPIKKQPPVLV